MRRPDFNPTYNLRKGSQKRDYQMSGGFGLGQYENALPSDLEIAPSEGRGEGRPARRRSRRFQESLALAYPPAPSPTPSAAPSVAERLNDYDSYAVNDE